MIFNPGAARSGRGSRQCLDSPTKAKLRKDQGSLPRHPAWILPLLVAAGCGAPVSSADRLPVSQDKRLEQVPDEVIVKYRAPEGMRAEATMFPEDIAPTRKYDLLPETTQLDATSFDSRNDTVLVKTSRGEAARVAAAYAARPEVEWAIPNARIQAPVPVMPGQQPGTGIRSTIRSNDPLVAQQWYLDRINAQAAWATSTGTGVTVAVLDTGIDGGHPDLSGAVEKGGDFISKSDDTADKHGHGTHVAGIVGARKDNGVGIVGVAPGCNLLAVRVLGESGGSGVFSVARGIKAAADYAKRTKKRVVINLSLGSRMPVDPVDFMAGWYATRQGALLVAAAGNEGGPVGVPAKHRYFMAIGATDTRDARASFSNFGSQLALSAPGVDIVSTTPTYPVTMTQRGVAQNFAALQGTSMATPIVSGVAALVWSKHPDWSPAQVRDALTKGAKNLGDRNQFGAGLVDAAAAVAP